MREDILILYRALDGSPEERAAIESHFRCSTSRLDTRPGDTVIGRYSVLPFYREVESDVLRLGGRLINTYGQHRYIADLREWYQDIAVFTPRTWFRLQDVPRDAGPFVLKGETNSIKQKWSTHMFAKDFPAAIEVHNRISEDAFIGGTQNIYIRQYVPLRGYGTAIGGHPVTQEFRFFVLDEKILWGDYYWSGHIDLIGEKPDPSLVPRVWLERVVSKIGRKARFYVIDVAETADGEWIVIELNDGQMSGLSCIRPEDLYASLAGAFCNQGMST